MNKINTKKNLLAICHKLSAKVLPAFTLIELLVVIAIIGILATLVMTNLQGTRERARDTARKSDFHALAQSLRLYYADNQSFPTSTSFAITGTGWGSTFVNPTTSTVYMNTLPHDPLFDTTGTEYAYYSATGTNYILVTLLENPSDPSISSSQANCPITYAAFQAASPDDDPTHNYVVCEE